MARRHQLTEKEVPEAIIGLQLRLRQHLETKKDLSRALTCFRTLYRLTMHEAHRPSYPEWSVKPDLEHPDIIWTQLKTEAQQLA